MRNFRFDLVMTREERAEIERLAMILRRSRGDAMRYLVTQALDALDTQSAPTVQTVQTVRHDQPLEAHTP